MDKTGPGAAMMIGTGALVLTVLTLLVVGGSLITTRDARKGVNKLILVSIDGLRHDMVRHDLTPNLARLATSGVSCPMRPAYPSTTFPNHFTMITGLRPSRHGIIGNVFFDAQLNDTFSSRHTDNQDFGRWLQDGEPIWNTLERNGGKAAVVHWVGSDAAYRGKKASHSFPFSKSQSLGQVTDLIIKWAGGRSPADLVVGYYAIVDSQSHKFGPGSPQLRQALRAVDKEVGRIMRQIEQQRRMKDTNLIVVSDHGTSQVTERVKLSALIANYSTRLTLAACSPVTFIYPRDGHADKVREELRRSSASYKGLLTVHFDGDLPKEWHFGGNPRIPPIVIQARPGVTIACDREGEHEGEEDWRGTGDHGFDPMHKDMRAVFMARGPQFKSNTQSLSQQPIPEDSIPDNVDVYRVVARCLNLPVGEDSQSGMALGNRVFK